MQHISALNLSSFRWKFLRRNSESMSHKLFDEAFGSLLLVLDKGTTWRWIIAGEKKPHSIYIIPGSEIKIPDKWQSDINVILYNFYVILCFICKYTGV